jgi:hypothetical protein
MTPHAVMYHRHCERSEAIQNACNGAVAAMLECFGADAPRNDGVETVG